MRKILIIDDDEAVRTFLSSTLTRLCYDVVQAYNGREGLARLSESGVDIVITDLFMPGIPFGIDLIRQLRQKKPAIPLVVISGEGDNKVISECTNLGVTEFLTKPFEMGFIKSVLDRLGEAGEPAGGHP